ncbi:MAG: EamA family transporter, partial [Azospira sp.]|nr:EamA family transporter [Azospira sp.]
MRALPALALLTGSLVWSLVWYPYRALRDAGFDGLLSTTLTYSIAFTLALLVWRPKPGWPARPWLLLALALAAGGCNIGYVLATLAGEVVRVLLLFFLAPLWTVLLARILLGERLNRFGAFAILLSLAGASTMLWQPVAGLPLPRDVADWLGLGAGFCFALFNVLSRRARGLPVSQRILVSFFGVAASGALLAMLFGVAAPPAPATVPVGLLLLPLLIG